MLPIYRTWEDALEGRNPISPSARLISGQHIWLCTNKPRRMRISETSRGVLFAESENQIAPLRRDDNGWFATACVSNDPNTRKKLGCYTKLKPEQGKEKNHG